ncbi:hypothetical protein [Paracoccus sp. PAR01]|uniref:hypothetical protein n=1 Tax=Paracoccus sp. PAR01 TaxID=2769282 RepID=UPI0017844715|nr:hypothetical protein [Paracoccus sp. PAR01]MBD9528500.1 hypothetical protein [Paracoccus sp. PAR01]
MRAMMLCLALVPAAGVAQDAALLAPSPISAEIAKDGISPVLERLQALSAPSPDERFATAGLEFLAAVEAAYQWRMAHQVGTEWGMMFGMGADLPTDARVTPFPPEALAQQTAATLAAMERLQVPLQGLAEGPEFGVALSLSDLWFDVDGDGKRAAWEGAGDLLNGVAYFREPAFDQSGQPLPLADLPVIRFDNADAAWLSAYGHLVAGMAELVLAFDPTPSLQKVWDARKAIDSHRAPGSESALGSFDAMLEPVAAVLDMLRHQPDPARTRAARDHWLGTVQQNRLFWKLTEAETDNAGEWIPNDRQVSATGLVFPPGTGPAWLSVLDDAEAVLMGRKSIPFWRAPVGLDLAKWLQDPVPLPLDGAIQGWAVTDFLTDAPMVTPESFGRFSQMFLEGGPFLAMVMIN